MVTLRQYQQDAVQSIFSYWTRGGPGSPLVELPTGAGKSLVIAEIVRRLVQDFDARVLIATHRKELISQDAQAVLNLWPRAPVAVYSAGLSRREFGQITVGGVQSLVSAARKPDFPSFDVVLIDEAHLVAPDDDTQYGILLSELRKLNPDLRLVGLTATPYRLTQGMLTSGSNALFNTITYQADVASIVNQGYLSPLVAPDHAVHQIDLTNVGTRAGEYNTRDLEAAADLEEVNAAVARDVAGALRAGRTSALVFSTTVNHARNLSDHLRAEGVEAHVVTGETAPIMRQASLGAFRRRELACICSCDVLTTGFDAPVVDTLAIVRATKSPGLYVQMVGRGMRLADGKKDCLLLDYGANVERHGPVTKVRTPKEPGSRGKTGEAPVKMCPSCFAEAPVGALRCLHCDYAWPEREVTVEKKASTLDPMGGSVVEPQRHDVADVRARVHVSKSSGKNTVCFDFLNEDGIPIVSEYVCLEHDGFARQKAETWWRTFFESPAPATCEAGVRAWRGGYMKRVNSIIVVQDGKYKRIKSADLSSVPPAREPGSDDDVDLPAVRAQESARAWPKTLDDVFQGDDIPF